MNWFEPFKAAFLTWLQTTPIFAHRLNCAVGCLLAVTDHRKDQISSHNIYPKFCWVNLEDFLTLGTLYCLISATRGNIVRIDSATDDTIRVSLTVAIRFTDASVNRYTPSSVIPHDLRCELWKIWRASNCGSSLRKLTSNAGTNSFFKIWAPMSWWVRWSALHQWM